MRNIKLYISGLALAGLVSLPLAAQSTAPGNPPKTRPADQGVPQPTPSATVPATAEAADGHSDPVPVASTANAPEIGNTELRPVSGELVSKLDSKNAKAGDSVVLKTTEKATTADGVVIPKGSKIMGHVTEVQAHDGSNENAKVTLQFDQAELKGGQTLPIKSVLQSLAPAEMNVTPTDTMNSPGMSGGPAGPMQGPSTGSAPSSRTTPQQSQAQSTTSGATPTATTGSSGGNGAPQAGTVVATQGNVAIRTTAIPGVLIASTVNGQPFSNASGALLGAKQNVHLDSGTHVVLALADAAPKAPNAR